MTTNVTGATSPHAATHGERHSAALSTLFFTEMWERFSYYGMRALLVLYLVKIKGSVCLNLKRQLKFKYTDPLIC